FHFSTKRIFLKRKFVSLSSFQGSTINFSVHHGCVNENLIQIPVFQPELYHTILSTSCHQASSGNRMREFELSKLTNE
ncbi:hypothetical protein, partial [Paenibacillus cookii]|uniref:hypothetical protein n=1 Tax=Paenibacillus cookii TaxID=157839 RepID=UPI001BB3E171